MKNIKNYIVLFLSMAVVIVACDDTEKDLVEKRKKDNQPAPEKEITGTAGSADFSTYIAIGNSITAGFMDGALYNDGQNNSYPNILSKQLKAKGVGGGEFNQPDINSVNGYNRSFSNTSANPPVIAGRTVLHLTKKVPVPTKGDIPKPYAGDKLKLGNFGVPGIQIGQLLTPFTGGPNDKNNKAFNALYARFASIPGTSTILKDALSRKPTFYTLWIGNMDILAYAATGGADPKIQITPTPAFQQRFKGVIDDLVQSKAKGVVINIPPILLAPFFRAVSWDRVTLDEPTATALNKAFAGYNKGLVGALQAKIITKAEHDKRVLKFKKGKNGIFIKDKELTDVKAKSGGQIPIAKWRQTNKSDLVPLSTGAVLGTKVNPKDPRSPIWGVSAPLTSQYILTTAEQVKIITARVTFNTIMKGIIAAVNKATNSNNIALYDTEPIFADLAGLTSAQAAALKLSPEAQKAADGVRGITKQGYLMQPDFSPGGIFSTDGIHPNPKGQAIIANEIIKTINSTWGAKIPEAQLINYRTVVTTK